MHPNIKLEKFGKSFVKKFCIQKLEKKKKVKNLQGSSSPPPRVSAQGKSPLPPGRERPGARCRAASAPPCHSAPLPLPRHRCPRPSHAAPSRRHGYCRELGHGSRDAPEKRRTRENRRGKTEREARKRGGRKDGEDVGPTTWITSARLRGGGKLTVRFLCGAVGN